MTEDGGQANNHVAEAFSSDLQGLLIFDICFVEVALLEKLASRFALNVSSFVCVLCGGLSITQGFLKLLRFPRTSPALFREAENAG